MARDLGDFWNELDRGRAGADHRHALAGEIEGLVRPVEGMERRAFEQLHALEPRQRGRGQHPQPGHDESRRDLAAVLEAEPPDVRTLVEPHRLDPAVELHVLAQAKLAGHEVEVAQVLRLRRELLGPMPLVEQFLGEGIAVGVALRVETGTGVAVVVPSAAKVGIGFEHDGAHAKVLQALDLIDAGHPGPDHHHFMIGRVCHLRALLDNINRVFRHAYFLSFGSMGLCPMGRPRAHPTPSGDASGLAPCPVGATLVVARVGGATAVRHRNTGDHKCRPYENLASSDSEKAVKHCPVEARGALAAEFLAVGKAAKAEYRFGAEPADGF